MDNNVIKAVNAVIVVASLASSSMVMARQGDRAANESDAFAKFKQQYQIDRVNFNNAFIADFDAYKKRYREDLAAFKQKVKKKWGYADTNTNKKLVVYSESLNEKVIIDYEKSQITVSSKGTGEKDKQASKALLEKTLNASVDTLNQVSPTTSTPTKQRISTPPITVAQSLGISQEQVADVAEQAITHASTVDETQLVKANIEALKAAEVKVVQQSSRLSKEEQQQEQSFVAQIKKERQESEQYLEKLTADPSAKNSQIRQLSIASNRWARSKPYRNYVKQQAQQLGLSPALLYAIMETESSFNPLAQSPIPAFGLMQVVPTSAGIDVHRVLHKHNERRGPSKEELFEPTTNVIYGSTYMNILNGYFAKVENEESRLYCAIAAYNTGPGNVAKTFNDSLSMKLKPAIGKINQLSPEQVLTKIKQKSHPETQGYIRKVLAAKQYFEQAM